MKPRSFLVLLSLVAFSGCHAARVARPPAPGLVIRDLVVGTGAMAKSGDTVTVQYEGWFSDSTKFDSTRGRSFWFVLGARQVILGWDLGMPGARVGGTRRLVIPPELAYGAAGVDPIIPPNATLIYEIALLDVRSPP